jgi:4-amino-4-deoxy-L-arabinose transferase-like glycosyltransferase
MKKMGFLVVLALALRIAALFILEPHIAYDKVLYFSSELDGIVSNILSGNGYVYSFLRTNYYFYGYPFYYYFLALIDLVTDNNYLAIGIFQALIAAFSVIPLFFIAEKIFNRKIAFISALLYCLHPGLVAYTAMPASLTFQICFILMIIYLMVCFEDKKWPLALAGILTGLSVLIRPTIIFFIPAFLIYLIVRKEPWRKLFLKLSIIGFFLMIVLFPWIYRGYKIYNRFIFVSLTSSESFWRGNNPIATGTGFTEDSQVFLWKAMLNEDFARKIYSLNEIGQYDFFKDATMKYIKAHPLDFFKITIRKFIYFWSFSPQTGLLYPARWLALYKMGYYFLATFFVLGVYFIFKNRQYVNMPVALLLFSVFIMISAFQSLFYVDTRHRWMLEPLLMIVSAHGIMSIFSKNAK